MYVLFVGLGLFWDANARPDVIWFRTLLLTKYLVIIIL
jgi:hypothetical protein